MLSYQHAYHAGNRADIQKHSLLAHVLEILTRKDRALTYMETHAGRGVYNLTGAEAEKTGEAAQGWLALNKKEIEKLPRGYVEAVKRLNAGEFLPLYPGSPLVAAQILRPQDEIHLMELHPQEHTALLKVFKGDRRVHIHKRDGLEGVLALSPPQNRRGLVLVDPSYEIKSEYETVPGFILKLVKKWPEVCVLVWIPMLSAGRHENMLASLKKNFPALYIDRAEWQTPGEGMFGSIMAGVNLPYGV